MKRGSVSTLARIALPALFVMMFLPVSTFAQRTLGGEAAVSKPRRNLSAQTICDLPATPGL